MLAAEASLGQDLDVAVGGLPMCGSPAPEGTFYDSCHDREFRQISPAEFSNRLRQSAQLNYGPCRSAGAKSKRCMASRTAVTCWK